MLVEWMEYHKNFGSKQAYLYAFNPGPYLSQVRVRLRVQSYTSRIRV